MALPKEPRQKMINMMYLVLTALLALNVSAEILNAFKTVDSSIMKSNASLTATSDDVYKSFEVAVADGKTRDKATPLKAKADQVKQITAEMNQYLEGLKVSLKNAADLEVKDGKETFKEDNLDAATRIFQTEGKGPELFARLQKFQNDIYGAIGDDVKKERFSTGIPVDLTAYGGQNEFTEKNFHMVPTVAGLTLLSKFQNDVKNTESQAVNYLYSKIGSVKIVMNQVSAIASANASYILPGTPVEITAGIGAFSEAAKPTITFGGASGQPGKDPGTFKYVINDNTSGTKTVRVNFTYFTPDGTQKTDFRDVTYTVGQSGTASISLEKMNVFYIGVDNPVTITGSVGIERVKPTMSNGTINPIGGGRYTVRVTSPGESVITVFEDGKSVGNFPFRNKRIPDPVVYLGNLKGSEQSKGLVENQGGLFANLDDFPFATTFRVTSFKMILLPRGKENQIFQGTGNALSDQMSNALRAAPPGSQVIFAGIKVLGPAGDTRPIETGPSYYMR
jgi:gliding motility-associated protein GldM